MSPITKFSPILASLILITPYTAAQDPVFVGGWAARTPGSCLAGEVDCGSRLPPFRACCPQGQFCRNPVTILGYEDNTACCATEADCSQQLLTYNVCANDEWGLYNNSGFPFCCPQGFRGGVSIQRGFDSCRPLNQPFPSGEIALPQDTPDSRVIIASTTTTTSSSPRSTSSSSLANTSTGIGESITSKAGGDLISNSRPGGLEAPAIAGVVVGIVALLALLVLGVWLFRRNKRKYHEKEGQLREVGGIQGYDTSNDYLQGSYDQTRGTPQPMHDDQGPEPVYSAQSPQHTYQSQTSLSYTGQSIHKPHPAGVSELSG
ncbi:hypothetical protein TWF718_006601 [Orbilia javanica]|uniref:Uncharacterized protein n=1 Tax=Orbilia javanica TaxID=47235 RepID=A0AAN8MSW7_9PEZI